MGVLERAHLHGGTRRRTGVAALGAMIAMCQWLFPAATSGQGIPITFELEKPAYVTLVIDDSSGVRVRNLIQWTRFPAGQNRQT